ncbi:MAG: 50S ribosomal protein L23 [bacterium]|nr:50S ribosomal protein L23 [bacterium]
MAGHLRTSQDVVQQFWFTERSTAIQEDEKRYTFKVDLRANKHQIKKAIETIFKVKVDNVHVMTVRGKVRRVRYRAGSTPHWKKAVVRLKPGYTIEF